MLGNKGYGAFSLLVSLVTPSKRCYIVKTLKPPEIVAHVFRNCGLSLTLCELPENGSQSSSQAPAAILWQCHDPLWARNTHLSHCSIPDAQKWKWTMLSVCECWSNLASNVSSMLQGEFPREMCLWMEPTSLSWMVKVRLEDVQHWSIKLGFILWAAYPNQTMRLTAGSYMERIDDIIFCMTWNVK